MAELKNSCPFCGVTAYLTKSYIPNGWTVVADHRKTCFLYGKNRATFDTPKRAIQAWNRRTNNG